MFVYITIPGTDFTYSVGDFRRKSKFREYQASLSVNGGSVRKEGTITLQCEIINKITGVTVQWISVKSHTFLKLQTR